MGEVAKGSTVMLLFSVKKGNLSEAVRGTVGLPKNINSAIYFNILGVVVLAEPAERFSNTPAEEGPQAFGVESIVKLPDIQESEDESDGEGPEEPFL